MWDDFIQGLVWALALASTITLGIALAPSLGAAIGELGYGLGRVLEWILDVPARILARARASR